MPVVVVAIASPAPDLCGLAFQQRDNGMVCQPPAFDAKIVDDVAQPKLTHQLREYITNGWTGLLQAGLLRASPYALAADYFASEPCRLRHSNKITPAATLTLREATPPGVMGIRTRKSQCLATCSWRPLPSAPKTKAVGAA